MKQLIVNADDFGYTLGVNRAIVDGCRKGIITSTSVLANGAEFDDAVDLARAEPGLDTGCHINLVEGAPVSPVSELPHLVGAEGRFHGLSGLMLRLAGGWIPRSELDRECSAQIEKLLRAGIQPSHVDTHQHTHLHPRVASAVAAAARRYSIHWLRRPFENCGPSGAHESGVRKLLGRSMSLFAGRFERRMLGQGIRLPDFFTGFGLTGRWTCDAMEATLSALSPGVTELMCHPGYYDAELQNSPTRLKHQRQGEAEILADPAWQRRLNEFGIVLKGFRDFPPASARAVREDALTVTEPATGG